MGGFSDVGNFLVFYLSVGYRGNHSLKICLAVHYDLHMLSMLYCNKKHTFKKTDYVNLMGKTSQCLPVTRRVQSKFLNTAYEALHELILPKFPGSG